MASKILADAERALNAYTLSQLVDNEVRRLLEEAYKLASRILSDNRHILERVSERLLDKETIGASEFSELIASLNPVQPTLQGA